MMMMRAGLALAAAALLAAAPAHAQRDTAREGTYELTAVTVKPRVLNAAELEALMESTYPPAKRDAGGSAIVTVRLVVTASGLPSAAHVVNSTDSAFNAPTLAAVSRAPLFAAQVNRRPVATHVEVPITWMSVPAWEAAPSAVDSTATPRTPPRVPNGASP